MLTHSPVSSTTIEEIGRHCRTSPSAAFAYFYFEFQNKDVRSQTVLRSLIMQLSFRCPRTPDALEKLFSENGEGRRSPTPEELFSTLKPIIGSFEQAYIVFDALDECQDRRDFLKVIEEMHSWGFGTLHLLATSRQEPDIADVLKPLVSHDVPMDQQLIDSDIRVHVSKTLDSDNAFKRYPEKDRKMVENALTEGAHGM